jgi:hypothetical protein
LEHKYALWIDTADETLSVFWEHAMNPETTTAKIFDHDDELLIFSTQEELQTTLAAIEALGMPSSEAIPLLLLPDSTDKRREFSDYGFMSHSNQSYVYVKDVYLFILNEDNRKTQYKHALEQMEEHLLASFQLDGKTHFVTNNHSDELMERIARAYECTITTVEI